MKKLSKKKDELWWIHPKFKAKQTFNTSDINLLDKESYIITKFKNKKDAGENSVFPVGQGKYSDFAKVLYKMNGYKTGPVKGWYVVICLENKKKWAVAQLRADPIRPVQIYSDLTYKNEKKATNKAASLRISDPGPTRLTGETIQGTPQERKNVESIELQRQFNLKLAGFRKKSKKK